MPNFNEWFFIGRNKRYAYTHSKWLQWSIQQVFSSSFWYFFLIFQGCRLYCFLKQGWVIQGTLSNLRLIHRSQRRTPYIRLSRLIVPFLLLLGCLTCKFVQDQSLHFLNFDQTFRTVLWPKVLKSLLSIKKLFPT